tara:strand:+ start:305 stop:736 length:432 start_codon:yes stop_codon:yes gene_type:complete
MNILFLEGPNLNLLGLKSSKINGSRLTLDKLNKHLRRQIRNTNHNLKIFQTHKQFQAVNCLQRNRNWSDGNIIIPTTWSICDWTIAETIKIIDTPTVAVFFNKPYDLGGKKSDSIIKSKNVTSIKGNPLEVCIEALNILLNKK